MKGGAEPPDLMIRDSSGKLQVTQRQRRFKVKKLLIGSAIVFL
jgi:hypothetical protein